jgi:hypothetical protein
MVSDLEIKPIALAETHASMMGMTGHLSGSVLSNALSSDFSQRFTTIEAELMELPSSRSLCRTQRYINKPRKSKRVKGKSRSHKYVKGKAASDMMSSPLTFRY